MNFVWMRFRHLRNRLGFDSKHRLLRILCVYSYCIRRPFRFESTLLFQICITFEYGDYCSEELCISIGIPQTSYLERNRCKTNPLGSEQSDIKRDFKYHTGIILPTAYMKYSR